MNERKNRFDYSYALPIGIAIVFLFFGFYKLIHTPGWYPDEAINLSTASNLLHGKFQTYSYFQSFLPHLPLTFLAAIPFIIVFGKNIIALRILSVLSGVAVAFAIYLALRLKNNPLIAGLAPLILLASPTFLGFYRLGITYTFCTALIGFVIFYIIKYLAQGGVGNLILSFAFSVALASSSLFGFPVMFAVFLIGLTHGKKKFLKYALIIVLPLVIFLAIMLATKPSIYIYAFNMGSSRAGGNVSSLKNYFDYTISMLKFEPLIVFGLASLVFVEKKVRNYLLIFIAILTGTQYLFSFHVFLMIPIFVISIALALRRIKRPRWAPPATIACIFVFLLLASPSYEYLTNIAQNRYFGPPAFVSSETLNESDTRRVAQYINENTRTDDLVIASPQISWLFDKANASDFLESVASSGQDTIFFNKEYKQIGGFYYDSPPRNAKFIVIDHFALEWSMGQPNVFSTFAPTIDWPVVLNVGGYQIKQNPNL